MIAKTIDQNADAAIHIERFEARPRTIAVSASAFDFVNGSNSGLLTIASTDRYYRDKCREFQPGSNGRKMPFGAAIWKLLLDLNTERWFPSR